MDKDYEKTFDKLFFLLNSALSHLPPNEEEYHPFSDRYELNAELARRDVLEAYSIVMSCR